jgi:hypothetical protein
VCSSKHGVVAESKIWRRTRFAVFDKIPAMIATLRHLLGWILSALSSREHLIVENLALRHSQETSLGAELIGAEKLWASYHVLSFVPEKPADSSPA